MPASKSTPLGLTCACGMALLSARRIPNLTDDKPASRVVASLTTVTVVSVEKAALETVWNAVPPVFSVSIRRPVSKLERLSPGTLNVVADR